MKEKYFKAGIEKIDGRTFVKIDNGFSEYDVEIKGRDENANKGRVVLDTASFYVGGSHQWNDHNAVNVQSTYKIKKSDMHAFHKPKEYNKLQLWIFRNTIWRKAIKRLYNNT